jgi:TRAP-type C4-dicarboxylate transport system permease small subunit
MLTRFNAALAKFCMVVAVIGLCTIVVCVLLQVFGRYVLNDTPTWAEALALVLVLWVTMFGAAVGVRDAGHIGMESLLVWVSEEKRRWLEMLIHLLSGLFGAMMAWQGTVLAESVMGYKIPTLGIPEGFNHLPVAAAGVMIVLFSIEHIIALVKREDVVPSWY